MAHTELARLEDLTQEVAAEHLYTNVPVVSPEARAGEIRALLERQPFDSITHVAVCENERLMGILRIEALLPAGGDALAKELMDADPPVVAPGVDQEVAAWRAVRHEESGLAVVDGDGRFSGFIPPHRLLAIMLWEHDEDIARLGGYMRDTASARTASQEPVVRRFFHRLPWLLIGLMGALLAAGIVDAFEGELARNVTLAFFVPGIVYLADAVGTQTEALMIRGLSVGVSIGQVAWREALTGLLVGAALALAFFPLAALSWGEADVALAVSLALFAASSTATLVAMALPWLFHRLGTDPAFGSGPLATVIQDLLSILIYFAIAVVVLG